ncbi:MAG: TfoX/Sxy family protein [Thiotrichales bacterium]|nr:MAG: TfoX/Sxy family protein [Thiotrichales bacterium]
MAYDQALTQRLREIIADRDDIVERKMFGGLAVMLSGNMCCGIVGEDLMARVGPGQYQSALSQAWVRKMDFTGKALKGFVYVGSRGIESDEELENWVKRCEDFVVSLPAKQPVVMLVFNAATRMTDH